MSEAELILVKLKIVSETEERGMYLCDKEHSKILLDYITNLQTIEKEYCVVLSENAELQNKIFELQKEIDRLNNNNQAMQEEMARTWEKLDKTYKIINELEKYLNEQIQKSWEIEEQCYEDILNKLQELKGDSSNE